MIETRITRRRFNTALAGSAAAAMFPTFARAQQNYPNRHDNIFGVPQFHSALHRYLQARDFHACIPEEKENNQRA